MIAVIGLAATSLAGLWLLNVLFPFLAWLRAAWGLLGVLLFFLGLLGGMVAFVVYLLRGKRARPAAEGGATIEGLETRQS